MGAGVPDAVTRRPWLPGAVGPLWRAGSRPDVRGLKRQRLERIRANLPRLKTLALPPFFSDAKEPRGVCKECEAVAKGNKKGEEEEEEEEEEERWLKPSSPRRL